MPSREAAEAAAALAAAMQHLIDDLPEQVALLTDECIIVAVNQSWTEAMRLYGYVGVAPGDNYRSVIKENAAKGYEPAARALAGIDEVRSGERDFWQMTFNGRGEWNSHEYQMSFHRVAVGNQSYITITRHELTELTELRRLKQEFQGFLYDARKSERQRMGRELHDSTQQLLATINLTLGRLKSLLPSHASMEIIEEAQGLLKETQQEIRSISYLSQPPALEKKELTDALRNLAEGFNERSGIRTVFEDNETELLPSTVQKAFYRVAQEALSNIYRHSHAKNARVELRSRNALTHLIISDDGIGISTKSLSGEKGGVGLAGMRLRLVELGGRLTIRRLSVGTAVVASVARGRS